MCRCGTRGWVGRRCCWSGLLLCRRVRRNRWRGGCGLLWRWRARVCRRRGCLRCRRIRCCGQRGTVRRYRSVLLRRCRLGRGRRRNRLPRSRGRCWGCGRGSCNERVRSWSRRGSICRRGSIAVMVGSERPLRLVRGEAQAVLRCRGLGCWALGCWTLGCRVFCWRGVRRSLRGSGIATRICRGRFWRRRIGIRNAGTGCVTRCGRRLCGRWLICGSICGSVLRYG